MAREFLNANPSPSMWDDGYSVRETELRGYAFFEGVQCRAMDRFLTPDETKRGIPKLRSKPN